MIADVAWETNALEKCMMTASCAPGPAGPTSERQMVQLETGPRKNDSHDGSENDVKPVVSMIEPTGSRYKLSNCEWDKCQNDHIDWRGGRVVSKRQGLLFL